jgi:hypothetical protein
MFFGRAFGDEALEKSRPHVGQSFGFISEDFRKFFGRE